MVTRKKISNLLKRSLKTRVKTVSMVSLTKRHALQCKQSLTYDDCCSSLGKSTDAIDEPMRTDLLVINDSSARKVSGIGFYTLILAILMCLFDIATML